MEQLSELQKYRLKYNPPLPTILKNLKSIKAVPSQPKNDVRFKEHFPHLSNSPAFTFTTGSSEEKIGSLHVGILFSGGQAPGGHNVISGLFDSLKELNTSSSLIGFLDGPDGLMKNRWIQLTEDLVGNYRNQGGFDLLGSGRTKIETQEQFEGAVNTIRSHHLDGLVIVGGDDSNTNAAFLAEYCKKNDIAVQIIGIPKTIDGDLKNQNIELSFGFDTASKVYSEIIGNLAKDSLSAKKYYFFIKMMGRSASHLTLECALQTQINLAIIGEEIEAKKLSLNDVVNMIVDLILQRASKKKFYGVILIPEGLLEFIPEFGKLIQELNQILSSGDSIDNELLKHKLPTESYSLFIQLPMEIQDQLLLDRDSHGNIQLSKIETERLLIELVNKVLVKRGFEKGKFNPQPLFCGYEARSALPSNFDCQYCYALGFVACLLILHKANGCMACIKNLNLAVHHWEIAGIPIVDMLDFEMRKNKNKLVIKKNLVDLRGAVFASYARQREGWKEGDHYLCPGPIQFDGLEEIVERSTITLQLEQKI